MQSKMLLELISNIGIKCVTKMKKILNAKRIIIVACGTSWHAGLVGEYLIESIAKFLLKLNMLLNLDTEIH